MSGQKYADLADLLLNNERAKNFYKSLPDSVQISISNNGSKICSMEELRQFANKANA